MAGVFESEGKEPGDASLKTQVRRRFRLFRNKLVVVNDVAALARGHNRLAKPDLVFYLVQEGARATPELERVRGLPSSHVIDAALDKAVTEIVERVLRHAADRAVERLRHRKP